LAVEPEFKADLFPGWRVGQVFGQVRWLVDRLAVKRHDNRVESQVGP
jgi:hypothetical protein